MIKKVVTKRKYDSSRRQAQARETKLQIVEAARMLFLERSYAGTTIDAIAEKAGVASETIYAIFRNKRKILSFLFELSVGGDDQPVPVIDRPEPQAVLHETDQHRQLTRFANNITTILERSAATFEIMRGAAKTEPEVARLLQRFLKIRLRNMTIVAEHVAANGPLREGMDKNSAGEMIWSITSPELYRLFTVDLGWSNEKYIRWLTDSLIRLLLP